MGNVGEKNVTYRERISVGDRALYRPTGQIGVVFKFEDDRIGVKLDNPTPIQSALWCSEDELLLWHKGEWVPVEKLPIKNLGMVPDYLLKQITRIVHGSDDSVATAVDNEGNTVVLLPLEAVNAVNAELEKRSISSLPE